MTANPPDRLARLREMSRAVLRPYDEAALRRQSHAELSPLLWHVGHVFFVENYWLAERVFGDTTVTDRWRALYFPELCAKDARSRQLPGPAALTAWTREVEAINCNYWQRAEGHRHALLEHGYLHAFVRQHYAQHLETMRMACAQLALLGYGEPRYAIISPQQPVFEQLPIAAGETVVGTDNIAAYDNEQPLTRRAYDAFAMSDRCINNGEWAAFMADGGYHRPALWDDAGWRWVRREAIDKPQHWQSGQDSHSWLAVSHVAGLAEPNADTLYGIGWYEARAFARWAGARLPSETEWEAAARTGHLTGIGKVWEWSADAFAPYPGFRAFPYDEYSMPWFDGAHVVARGASRFSEPDIRRTGFRNFYPPTHRHIFAGLRLAWS